MDINAYLAQYKVLLSSAFSIALLIWLGYMILAPWTKSKLGWLIWSLWLAITLILFIPFISVHGIAVPFPRYMFIVSMYLFNIVLLFCGIGVYNTQIRGYLKYKKARRIYLAEIKDKEKS